LFHSKDGGQNWTRVEDNLGNPFIASGEISALEFAPSDPKILYLATSDGAVYRASNGGSHKDDWKRVDTLANGSALFPNFRIQSIAVNPKNSAIVWVVFGGNGVTPSDRNWDIVHHPSGVSHVFLSEDSGVHWKDVSGRHVGTSLPDVPTSAIALHEDPYIAYVGTDVGVYLTVTKGETWDKFQDGMPRCPITELRLNAVHKHLYASTMGRGIFVRKVN
jgi:photosystem II stability/assembly factor-like uncharacterized protein